jgi:ribosomal-protein-alanine N-acetyltransferase
MVRFRQAQGKTLNSPIDSPMHLPCGPCSIRSWQSSDLDALVHHANNPRIAQNMRDRFPSPYTRAAGEAWFALVAQLQPETNFAIEVDGEAAGGIGMILGKDIERVSAEIGYWLGESVWGRGIATAAVVGLSAYAFAHFDLTRLFAMAFADNTASRRVLEKAGYTFDCILRRSAIKNGQIRDQALYSLLRHTG